jgi:hypothetical protein
MDKRLLDTCRYTGIKPTETNDSNFEYCPDCNGPTKKTELVNRECRCSHCGKKLV